MRPPLGNMLARNCLVRWLDTLIYLKGFRADSSMVSGLLAISGIDVVDGARFRHRSGIGWFVGDESHEGSRPHAHKARKVLTDMHSSY